MIVVIDYNVGNVKSVCNAFRHIGCEAKLSKEAGTIENSSGLVLPGVAAFRQDDARVPGLCRLQIGL